MDLDEEQYNKDRKESLNEIDLYLNEEQYNKDRKESLNLLDLNLNDTN